MKFENLNKMLSKYFKLILINLIDFHIIGKTILLVS